jgi:hypothetical protein
MRSGRRRTSDLPALVKSMQPKIGELATKALGIVAGLGGSLLMFIFSFIVAGIMMAWGEAGAQAMLEIFERVAGLARGKEFTTLSTATVRAVASGVIGIACIQALIIGVSLMIAGVPFAGVLAVIVLVLGIAQLPALLVTLPVIGWIWTSGDYGTVAAAAYSVLLFVAGMADNVLKPLMLGRGVDAPMPVILIGALGGMATTASSACSSARRLAGAGLPDLHALGGRQSGTDTATGRRRFILHRRLSRCGDASPAQPAAPARPRRRAVARRLRRGRAGLQAARGAGAGRLVGRLAGDAGGGKARRPRRGGRGMVAQLRRPGARRAGRRGAARQPERAHGRHAHPGGARATGDRRQPALSATAAGDRQGLRTGTEASSGPDTR